MPKKTFITEDFALRNRTAGELYRTFARDLPIIDYHCHLPPAEIANDQRWDNLAQLWLGSDHYKWRQMRTAGIPEKFCTGTASDKEKFLRYAGIMPKLLRNPLYHWSHLELKRYFGIDDLVLGPDTAEEVWERANARIRQPGFSARNLILDSKVEVVCTTDDPADSLEHHRKISADGFAAKILPTWRPDLARAIHRTAVFNAWLDKLAAAAGMEVASWDDLLVALRRRHDFFHACGCRLSDHGLETVEAEEAAPAQLRDIFARARKGQTVGALEVRQFQAQVLHELAVMDAEKGWTMQLHLGPTRNNCRRLFESFGPDAGADGIGDPSYGGALSKFLDRLDYQGRLPKTILYNLNPKDSEMLVALAGCFQDGSVAGKVQYGAAWWFLDQMDGMTRQIEALSQLGQLGQSVGMLTDSRSFLSYTRHDYFRRILCSIVGGDLEAGLIPDDLGLAGNLVADVCYRNARHYFGF